MMTDLEFKDTLIDMVICDKHGLYEAFWGVPGGDIYDTQFGYSKERSWESVAAIMIELVERGFISVQIGNYRSNERVNEGLEEILRNKDNWEPFDIIEGRGYLLDKGDELKARLAAGKSSRQRPPD